MTRKITIGLTLAGLLLTAVDTGLAFEPLTHYGFDDASKSDVAQQGLEEIFAGRLFHEAVPVATARMMLGGLTAFGGNLGYDPKSDEGRFYATGRLPSPEDRAVGADEQFALGESVFERDGVQMVSINCFHCHAGVVAGQVVAGLGNSHITQSGSRRSKTRGDNFGPYEVWRLSSQLVDPVNQGLLVASETSDLQKFFNSVKLPPVDPMPWWLMKYKTKDYWYADAGPHDAASFSINFTTPYPEMEANHAEHVDIVAKALAFARETQSPLFPAALDAGLVQRGADLFHGRVRPENAAGFRSCKSCHGTYTRREAAGDLTQPGSWMVDYSYSQVLRNVKTDPTYNETLQQFKPIADHVNQLAEFYVTQGSPDLAPHAAVPDRSGYVAPPLVGVWASAPYFHNGSVPTIEAVLNSSVRPEIWSRNPRDPHAYELGSVGLAYQNRTRAEFEQSAAAAKGKMFLSQEAIDHSAIYDTQVFGHGNMGHTFGDNLTNDERFAIIEFLKSLSGPDM